jgi:2-(1,2-epoxy-1,2-dihydrophenyl)acetyl-CoA isomerase
MDTTTPAILVDRSEPIGTITLNRPEKLNAFAGAMREELLAALDALSANDRIRALVITGAGRGFCAGGDVAYMGELQATNDTRAFRSLLETGARVVERIRSMPQVVVAAVNGVAAGAGCSLALACDYRIAADSAKLGLAFVKIGLHPDWGASWSLPRLVGPSRAIEILATGHTGEAAEALAIGMVDRVTTPDRLLDEARILAMDVANGPGGAIADIKRAVWAASGNDLGRQLAVEAENQLRAFTSADGREGISAFLEKRPARFS